MIKNIFACAAAAGLALAPLAAQAGTRANASEVSLAPLSSSQARLPSAIGQNEALDGEISPVFLIIGGLVVIWGIIELTSSKGIIH
ncbi:hypothetical protein GCM10009127_03300 [Alteraurantiacibacter aestuarii]|uniref:Uncharacterized protein n=1 Tax=Alteraurantiacibacter aestuarii TaxID=650004 RepID=A0A844ZMV8_9SPHN|nr:hypothetical protein [Alteraurantiacibacter aestuarii]MXO88416.1 hypothetical protein [Alteraurantiacibacter aestuarii]